MAKNRKEQKDKIVGVAMEPKLYQRVKLAAMADRRSVSSWLYLAALDRLEEHEKRQATA